MEELKEGDYVGYQYNNGNWLYLLVIGYEGGEYRVKVIKDMDTQNPKWERGEIRFIRNYNSFVKLSEKEMLYEVL